VSLVLNPGAWPYFTQLDEIQAPAWLQPAAPGAALTGVPRMPASALAGLVARKLPGLQALTAAADAHDQAEFFLELRRLGALSSLDLLGGAPVQSKALQVRQGAVCVYACVYV
jgi:hypothetical protein